MELVHLKEALSFLYRVHLFSIQNEGNGSLQHVIEGVINMVEGITIHNKSNYRPVSILSLLLKPFERILYEQIDNHTKDILSKYQGGFRKKFSSQHSLLAMFEKWKKY